MKFDRKRIDPALRVVLRELAQDTPQPQVTVTVSPDLIRMTAESATKLRSPGLAALALSYLKIWDGATLAAIDSRKTRELSMTAPLPDPEVRQSTRLSINVIDWALQSNQPDPVDLLSRPSKCLHGEIHPADVPITRKSTAAVCPLQTVHALYHPFNPHAASYRQPNPNYRMPERRDV
jgi:hypothetical protein